MKNILLIYENVHTQRQLRVKYSSILYHATNMTYNVLGICQIYSIRQHSNREFKQLFFLKAIEFMCRAIGTESLTWEI